MAFLTRRPQGSQLEYSCALAVFYGFTCAVIQILMGQSCMKKHQILLLHIGSVLPSLHFYLAFIVESSLDFSLDEIFRFCGHWHPATTRGSLLSIWYESHFLQNSIKRFVNRKWQKSSVSKKSEKFSSHQSPVSFTHFRIYFFSSLIFTVQIFFLPAVFLFIFRSAQCHLSHLIPQSQF